MLAKPEHELVYQDVTALLARHQNITSVEMLAVVSNLVGKLIALQDQRTMTREKALEIVLKNLELGNKQVFDQLQATAGRA